MALRMTIIRQFEIPNQKKKFWEGGIASSAENFWAALDLPPPRLQVLDLPLSSWNNPPCNSSNTVLASTHCSK